MWVGLPSGGAVGLDVCQRHDLMSEVDVDAGQEKLLAMEWEGICLSAIQK